MVQFTIALKIHVRSCPILCIFSLLPLFIKLKWNTWNLRRVSLLCLYADLVIVNFMGGHYQEYILKKTITIKKDSIYAYNTKLAERDDTRHCDLIVHFIRLVMYLAPERRSAYSYNLNVYTTPSWNEEINELTWITNITWKKKLKRS